MGLSYLSKQDRDVLFKIISKYRTQIWNKKTDAKTNKIKREAWHNICREYNASSENSRTVQQVRSFWKVYGKQFRKDMSWENGECLVTKGNPCKPRESENESLYTSIVAPSTSSSNIRNDSSSSLFPITKHNFREANSEILTEWDDNEPFNDISATSSGSMKRTPKRRKPKTDSKDIHELLGAVTDSLIKNIDMPPQSSSTHRLMASFADKIVSAKLPGDIQNFLELEILTCICKAIKDHNGTVVKAQ